MINVRCSAAAKHEARLTAVVVFPTPPFWLAMAMTRAKMIPQFQGECSRDLQGCKMFHVEHQRNREGESFHVEQKGENLVAQSPPHDKTPL